MFQNRNSQKPSEELIANFKASFPGLSSSGSRSGSLTAAAEAGSSQLTTSLTDALDVAVTSRQQGEHHDLKDLDPTPRANADQWRFTPSLLDPNSFAFSQFANQPPGYYTPTPGGTNTIYHPQAGDLHTPGFTLGLGTPLSMPTAEAGVQIGNSPQQAFEHQTLAPHVFQNPNPFAFQHHQQPQHHQQTFAPHQFTHQPSHFEPFQHHVESQKMDEYPVDVEMQEQPVDAFAPPSTEMAMSQQPAPHQMENFRYHVTLNAPTAMIKHADEIPVTYLNKGQAYSMKIIDTKAAPPSGTLPTYRTFVRISFEDEQQRQRPAQCWQLWKEGRGTTEAHQRGGRLQAVEFVDPNSAGAVDSSVRPHIELESSSFDGFSVKWTPAPHAPSECHLSLRFNFLSTDFSHSKGVKGIPVRLCAKTQLMSGDAPLASDSMLPEICYCKVKLFRDHGAERKLSNDIAHVKKSIDKLKQQIAQLETGMKDFGKRKRSESGSKPGSANRPGKVQKHKRTWSMSSASDTGAKGSSQEEDLHSKLTALQDMFTSTRPVSVLFLKGDDSDDADLNPVSLNMEATQTLSRVETSDSQMWEKSSGKESSIISPTPSHHSLASQERENSSGFQQPTPFQPSGSNEWTSQTATSDLHGAPQSFSPPNVPVKISRESQDGSQLASWIEALGVDYTYQPPPERIVKPVACVYIQPRIQNEPPKDNYYRAVYLMQKTLKDLVNGVAVKSNIEPSKVLRVLVINKQGLPIVVDDEVVGEIPEGQDMVAEFQPVRQSSPMKREWDSGPTDIQVDGDIDVIQTVQSEGYELRLLF
jgi:hypothetical protein